MPDIERELRELAATVVVPEPPDVRAAVRARIVTPPPRLRPARPIRPRWVVAVAAALLAFLLVASPQARAAVAEVFRFAGVDVHWGSDADDAPVVPESPLPGTEPTDLSGAREQAKFEISVPTRLGYPDRVIVADPGESRIAAVPPVRRSDPDRRVRRPSRHDLRQDRQCDRRPGTTRGRVRLVAARTAHDPLHRSRRSRT